MDIITQAARAVRKEMGAYAAGDDLWMVEGGVRSEGQFRDIVRAVLAAVGEPSEEMMIAHRRTDDHGPWRTEATAAWHAMIDAALALPDPAQAVGEKG